MKDVAPLSSVEQGCVASSVHANSDKIILHLCASKYGSDTLDYVAAGYDVRLITKDVDVRSALFSPDNKWLAFNGIEPIETAKIYGIIANPPCTMFSRARTTAKTPRDLNEGLILVKECLRIIWECQAKVDRDANPRMPLKFWALENPETGYLKWFLGKPAFVYRHKQFGGNASKTTALWGIFNPPAFFMWSSQEKEIWGGWKTTDERSIAPPQFTKAFFLANP